MANAEWYVVHTYSGYENKVKRSIESAIENDKKNKTSETFTGKILGDYILKVAVPVEKVVEYNGSKKRTIDRKLFPGYVFVQMIMDDDTWYVVRNTRGVTGFVGPGSKPVPLSKTEIEAMGLDKELMDEKVGFSIDFKEGDEVIVTGGAWQGTKGIVQKIAQKSDKSKHTVTLVIDVFGRATLVELDAEEVKLFND